MAQPLLTDELRRRIEPRLPPPKPRRCRFAGRKPLTHRRALTGILFVRKTGLTYRGIRPRLARRHTGHGSGLGIFRWVVERACSHRHRFRMWRPRRDWALPAQGALLKVACWLICLNILLNPASG
jgi:hypothetical protein